VQFTSVEDGAARIGATICGELLNAVFANVGQRAVRKVARETFEHLLNLDLRFHLSRQTGGLTRAIDRGTKYVSSMFSHRSHLTTLKRDYVSAPGDAISHRAHSVRNIYGLWDSGKSYKYFTFQCMIQPHLVV
jgi:ABC-type multidrug transport system fused ATPase/permease subunit